MAASTPVFPDLPLTPQMRAVLGGMARAARPPMHTLAPEQARAAYEAGAGVLEIAPAPLARVEDLGIPARDGARLPARLYAQANPNALPVLLYLHGGGFTIGSIATHDVLCRELAHLSGAAVLSLGYRLAPEHRFPTASNDTWDALAWLAAHAGALGLDASRIAIGGDSAGGTLAAAGAVMARDAGLKLALQLLFYPGTTAHQDTPSHARFADGPILDKAAIDWFFGNYIDEAEREDWRFAPLLAPDVARVDRPRGARPAGRRRHRLGRPPAHGGRRGRPGNLPRRDARIHQDGPRAARGAPGAPRCRARPARRL